MFARHRQLFATAIFALDGFLLFASWMAAYGVRFHLLDIPTPYGVPPVERYLWFAAVQTPIALLVLRSFRLYRSARTVRLSQELWSLVQGVVIVVALAALASFSFRGELSRSVLALYGVIAAVTLCGAHATL